MFQSPDSTMREVTVTNAPAGAKHDIDIAVRVVRAPCVYANHAVQSRPDLIAGDFVPDGAMKDVTASDASKPQGGNKADWVPPEGMAKVPPGYTGKTFVKPCGCQAGPPCEAADKEEY